MVTSSLEKIKQATGTRNRRVQRRCVLISSSMVRKAPTEKETAEQHPRK